MTTLQDMGAYFWDLHATWAQGRSDRFVPPIDVGVCGGNVGNLLARPQLEELWHATKEGMHHLPINQVKLVAVEDVEGVVSQTHHLQVRPKPQMITHVR
jgi:hypothetical protein